jgi:hypothetical protein
MCAGSWVNKSETHCARLICFSNRSSAVISIGAATLADIFDPAVRGKKVLGVDLCVFPWLTLYRSWEFTTLHHYLDRYFFTLYRAKFLIYLCPRLLDPYLEVY